MVSSEGPSRDLVEIYVAESVLEASMIRSRLAEEGIECLIPGEDLESFEGGPLKENAILVPEGQRDEALRLLEEVWTFFESTAEDAEGGDEGADA
ncbi:MAG: DUF2007 domain-containing protein [bacterium]